MPRIPHSLLCLALVLFSAIAGHAQKESGQWPTYGGDPGGQHYTASNLITKANVSQLTPAWTYHSGDVDKEPGMKRAQSFEATPILFRGNLYLSTPYDEIIALDPTSGRQLWKYDPQLLLDRFDLVTSRGVAAWPLETSTAAGLSSTTCSSRIFIATIDRRLIAVDAAHGRPCKDFGYGGEVDLSQGVDYRPGDRYIFTSPPTVVGDVVIVGSSIADNIRVDMESGLVRAFDVHSGRLVWSWEPLPWAAQRTPRTGAANAWSIISADPAHNLVFIPTGSPSPDFYGGFRPGDNRDANSVVALEATTGRRVWAFQVVHHDLWDYDVASEPLLFNFRGTTPAIAITTKMGMVFVLNRLTGEPLFPIEERQVPASDIPGEHTSPTQPFQQIDSLSPLTLALDKQLGGDAQDDADCRKIFSRFRYDGIYTPPSLRGSIEFPGSLGGVNWGGASFDPSSGILYANTNRYAFSVTLLPQLTRFGKALETAKAHAYVILIVILLLLLIEVGARRGARSNWTLTNFALLLIAVVLYINHRDHVASLPPHYVQHFGNELALQTGAPFRIYRAKLTAPKSGLPCTSAPWGTVSALNLNTGKAVWQTPLGTELPDRQTGTVNLGGDLVTGSGLLFTAASTEPFFRAFDSTTGQELWKTTLPTPAQATPMSYTIDGRQYVVIAAGGNGQFDASFSDALIAYALPKP